MTIQMLIRASHILQEQPGNAMAATELHAALVNELGTDAGTYDAMCQLLKKRPQSFMVLRSPWQEYVAFIEQDDDDESALGRMGRTLSDLWHAAKDDGELRSFLGDAIDQMVEISSIMAAEAEHPTTRPPDPRQ